MNQLITALAGALIVLLVGLPLLLLRRKTLLAIVKSGDVSRIPKVKRAKYEKKGIPESGYMAEFERETVNFAMKHPLLWAFLCAGICFVFLFIQGGMY